MTNFDVYIIAKVAIAAVCFIGFVAAWYCDRQKAKRIQLQEESIARQREIESLKMKIKRVEQNAQDRIQSMQDREALRRRLITQGVELGAVQRARERYTREQELKKQRAFDRDADIRLAQRERDREVVEVSRRSSTPQRTDDTSYPYPDPAIAMAVINSAPERPSRYIRGEDIEWNVPRRDTPFKTEPADGGESCRRSDYQGGGYDAPSDSGGSSSDSSGSSSGGD